MRSSSCGHDARRVKKEERRTPRTSAGLGFMCYVRTVYSLSCSLGLWAKSKKLKKAKTQLILKSLLAPWGWHWATLAAALHWDWHVAESAEQRRLTDQTQSCRPQTPDVSRDLFTQEKRYSCAKVIYLTLCPFVYSLHDAAVGRRCLAAGDAVQE